MTIDKSEIERYKSRWGNRFNDITIEDLLGLLQGKVLYLYDGEYANFIYLEDENVKEKFDTLTILKKAFLENLS